MHLWDLEVVLLKLGDQLGGIKLAVAASGLDDLGLLLQGEVLPGEIWTDVLLEKGKDLVVGDGAGVGEVVNASILVLREEDSGWEQVMEDGVGVWDINDTLVLGDLGDKVAAVKVVADRHSQSQDEHIGIGFHDLANVSFHISCGEPRFYSPPQRGPWSRSRKSRRSWPCQSRGSLGRRWGASHRMCRCIRWRKQSSGSSRGNRYRPSSGYR